MSDPQFQLKLWFHERTKPHGVKARLAEATGFTPTQISRMRNLETDDPKKRQEIPPEMIRGAAIFFRELPPGFDTADWLDDAEPRTVPLVGYVGAGAEAHFYANGDGELDRVPAGEGWTPSTVAVEVHGESLGALFDRWIIHYDDVRSPVTPDLIGKVCVVGLEDDRVLVKQIKLSRVPGLYHLLSNTEGPILDVAIAWAAKVKNMVPR